MYNINSKEKRYNTQILVIFSRYDPFLNSTIFRATSVSGRFLEINYVRLILIENIFKVCSSYWP